MYLHRPLQRRHSAHSNSPLPNLLTVSKAAPIDLLPFMAVRKPSLPATPQMHSSKPLADSLSPKSIETQDDSHSFIRLMRPRSSLEVGLLGERLGMKIAARRRPGPAVTTVVVKVRKPTRGNSHEKLRKGLSWLELPQGLDKFPVFRKNARSKSKKYMKSQGKELAVRAKCVWKRAKFPTMRKSLRDLTPKRAKSQMSRCFTSSFDKMDQCTECCLDTDAIS